MAVGAPGNFTNEIKNWGPRAMHHGCGTELSYGSNAVVGALLTELYPTRMRTTAYALCGSAPLSTGFAIYPALVPLAVQGFGWQWSFTVMIAPLLLVSALAALVLPRVLSGSDVDAAAEAESDSAVR